MNTISFDEAKDYILSAAAAEVDGYLTSPGEEESDGDTTIVVELGDRWETVWTFTAEDNPTVKLVDKTPLTVVLVASEDKREHEIKPLLFMERSNGDQSL